MKITNTDLNEVDEIIEMLLKIEKFEKSYLNDLTKEIYFQQPFFLELIRGYSLELTEKEYEGIVQIHFLIWEYFKAKGKIPTKRITVEGYENIQMRHIQMLKYTEGESNRGEVENIFIDDFAKIKSKTLFTFILVRFNTHPSLMNMDSRKTGMILIGVKTIIECFESQV